MARNTPVPESHLDSNFQTFKTIISFINDIPEAGCEPIRSSVSYIIYNIHKIVITTVCSTYSITFNVIFFARPSYIVPCCDQTLSQQNTDWSCCSKVSKQTEGTLGAQKHWPLTTALWTHLRIKAVHNIKPLTHSVSQYLQLIRSHSAKKPMTITSDICQ